MQDFSSEKISQLTPGNLVRFGKRFNQESIPYPKHILDNLIKWKKFEDLFDNFFNASDLEMLVGLVLQILKSNKTKTAIADIRRLLRVHANECYWTYYSARAAMDKLKLSEEIFEEFFEYALECILMETLRRSINIKAHSAIRNS